MARQSSKSSGKLPANDILWEQYFGKDDVLMFVMTSDRLVETYTLYHHKDGIFTKLGSGKSPPELEKKFSVNEIILGKLEYNDSI